MRRDCLPHRGPLLELLGRFCLVGGLLGVFCLPPLGPAVLLLGLLVWATARRDLEAMRAGERNPAGAEQTEAARGNGLAGMISGLVALGVLAILLYCYGLFD